VVLGLIAIVLFLHGFAYLVLYRSADLPRPPDQRILVMLTGTLALYGSMMLSQAMEAVTRAFYGRGDLDLILSSPVAAWRLFAVRIGAIAVTIAAMSLALAAPFINILAWFSGLRWLAGYGVILSLAMVTVAVAVMLTVGLFRTIGPKYTRLGAQIVAAVIGASFAIGVQLAAILYYGTPSRLAFLQSEAVTRYAPDSGSTLWLPARAILSDMLALVVVFGLSAIMFAAAICIFAPRFGQLVLATAGVSGNPTRQGAQSSGFRRTWPTRSLRAKEWTLLRRDPWLMSQILMQLLYLVPPAFILWRNFREGSGAFTLLVPILIVAAGQLAGGLAWLAISGEDAPGLIASAPVTNACALRAKTAAVMSAIAIVFGPFVIALAVVAPISALAAALGVTTAAASATSIQFWFLPKQSAAAFGAAKLRRVSPLLPRRYRRVAGPAPADWQRRTLGSPPFPDLSPSQLSPAHGSLARQRVLRAGLAPPATPQCKKCDLVAIDGRQIRASIEERSRVTAAKTRCGFRLASSGTLEESPEKQGSLRGHWFNPSRAHYSRGKGSPKADGFAPTPGLRAPGFRAAGLAARWCRLLSDSQPAVRTQHLDQFKENFTADRDVALRGREAGPSDMEKNGTANTRLRRVHVVADDDQQIVYPVGSPELFGVSGIGPLD